jgi:hypothetical protein
VLGADGLKIQRELAWQGEALLGLDPHRLAADGIVIDRKRPPTSPTCGTCQPFPNTRRRFF